MTRSACAHLDQLQAVSPGTPNVRRHDPFAAEKGSCHGVTIACATAPCVADSSGDATAPELTGPDVVLTTGLYVDMKTVASPHECYRAVPAAVASGISTSLPVFTSKMYP